MIKKQIAFIGIICIIISLFCSCSSQKSEDISLYDLKNAMAGATDRFSEMTYASSEDSDAENIFKNVSDMSYSKVKGFFVYYATNGTGNADEIAVIQVKNGADLSEARKSLEAHLEKRKSLYSTYDKSQLKKLDNARIVTSKSCAALIVGDEVDKIADAFKNFFSGE